jgi:hypothetical protein
MGQRVGLCLALGQVCRLYQAFLCAGLSKIFIYFLFWIISFLNFSHLGGLEIREGGCCQKNGRERKDPSFVILFILKL